MILNRGIGVTRRVALKIRSNERLGVTFMCRFKSMPGTVFRGKGFSSTTVFDHSPTDCTPFASLMDNGNCVALQFAGEDAPTKFQASFLWSVDPNFLHPTSGQRMRSLSSMFGYKILSVATSIESTKKLSPTPSPGCLHSTGVVYQVDKDEENGQTKQGGNSDRERHLLNVSWESNDGDRYVSSYDIEWLLSRRYNHEALQKRQALTEVTPQTALRRHFGLTEIDYATLKTDPDKAKFQILDTVFREGAVLVTGATPDTKNLESTVRNLALKLAKRISHGLLYGDIFHVRQIPNAHNIAYTMSPLPMHQDLSYYTSKPGLQLLHCVNHGGTVGGESMLLDGLAAATEFRRLAPDLYQILLTYEATFVKQRDDADMVFRRPHIEQDSAGIVTALHWSPPFEGPLAIDENRIDDYFVAYTAFERMVNDFLPVDRYLLPIPNSLERQLIEYSREFTVDRKLRQGDIMIFNNQRILHGRRSFSVDMDRATNGRHLVGCYTDLDETLNQYRLLRRHHLKELGVPEYTRNPGNGSSSLI